MRIKSTMSACRKYPGAAVHLVGANSFILPVWCSYLVAAGFDEIHCNKAGCRTFSTNCFEIVRDAFDCLPHGTDPFFNYTSIKSEGIFNLSKAANHLEEASIVMNLRTSKLTDIQRSAKAELPERHLQRLTKSELCSEILKHRISNKTYLGMSAIFHLVVDDENSFEVLVKPGRFSKALIRLTFTVSKSAINFKRGQRPISHKLF
jgi:hypothetical protein